MKRSRKNFRFLVCSHEGTDNEVFKINKKVRHCCFGPNLPLMSEGKSGVAVFLSRRNI